MERIFFTGWEPLLRTAIVAALAYPLMLLMVRISGNRTLAKLNAFDFIITIALGSTLASVITSQDLALAQGVLAFALLLGMQFLLSFAASRSRKAEQVLIGEPTLLFHAGRYLEDALNRARVTQEELAAAARSQGLSGMSEVKAVVLETNGELSVIQHGTSENQSALASVPRYEGRDE